MAAGHPKRTIECLTGNIYWKSYRAIYLRFLLSFYFYQEFIYFTWLLLGVGLKGQDQKDQNDDGLFNRFLISVAFKYRPNRETVEPNDQIPKLGHLFYLTKKLHRNAVEYVYSDDGNIYIDEEINLKNSPFV